MPRRVWVRGHYRNTRNSGCGGGGIALILLLIVVVVMSIIASIPAWAWIVIVPGLCIGAISLAKHNSQKQQLHQQQAQTPLQQAQMYYYPPGRSISQETKVKVYARGGGRCVQCGSPYDLQYDHIIPFSLGGGNGPENIQILCGPCNRRKYNHI